MVPRSQSERLRAAQLTVSTVPKTMITLPISIMLLPRMPPNAAKETIKSPRRIVQTWAAPGLFTPRTYAVTSPATVSCTTIRGRHTATVITVPATLVAVPVTRLARMSPSVKRPVLRTGSASSRSTARAAMALTATIMPSYPPRATAPTELSRAVVGM